MRKIEEAEMLLRRASQMNQVGPFQLEAAIQSAHTFRRLSGHNNWPYWATRAELLSRLGRFAEAIENYHRAIGLAIDPAVRSFLQERANKATA